MQNKLLECSTVGFGIEMKKLPFRSGFSQRDRRLNVESRLFLVYAEHTVANSYSLSLSLCHLFHCCCVVHCFFFFFICFDDDNKLMQLNYYHRCVEHFFANWHHFKPNLWPIFVCSAQFFTFVLFYYPVEKNRGQQQRNKRELELFSFNFGRQIQCDKKMTFIFSYFCIPLLCFLFHSVGIIYISNFKWQTQQLFTLCFYTQSKNIRLALLLL